MNLSDLHSLLKAMAPDQESGAIFHLTNLVQRLTLVVYV